MIAWCRNRRSNLYVDSQTVVSQPAAPNFGVANSMIYVHCGNNLFEPASVFNKLAKAGNRNSGLRIRASGSQSINTNACIATDYEKDCPQRPPYIDSFEIAIPV